MIGPLSLNMKAVVNAQQNARKKKNKKATKDLENKFKVLLLQPLRKGSDFKKPKRPSNGA